MVFMVELTVLFAMCGSALTFVTQSTIHEQENGRADQKTLHSDIDRANAIQTKKNEIDHIYSRRINHNRRNWTPNTDITSSIITGNNELTLIVEPKIRSLPANGGALPVASNRELYQMCKEIPHKRCEFRSENYLGDREVVLHQTPYVLARVLAYLMKKGIRIHGIRLVLVNAGRPIRRIAQIDGGKSEDYEFQYSEGKPLQLNADYRKYITQGVKMLRIGVGNDLDRIDEKFFSSYFPNISRLEISGGDTRGNTKLMEELHVGFLPYLKNMRISYPINGQLVGCSLPEGQESCFSEGFNFKYTDRYNRQAANMSLTNLHLPELISSIEISLYHVNLRSGTEFEGRTIDTVYLNASSTNLMDGISFLGAHLKTRFTLEGGEEDSVTTMARNLDGILKSPSIAANWYWEWTPDKLVIPVVFGTSSGQAFQDMKSTMMHETCGFANDVVMYANNETFSRNPSTNLTYRALYVDITQLIDEIVDRDQPVSELNVTAFHVHVSATRKVKFILRVSYMKITATDGAVIGHEIDEKFRLSDRKIMKSLGSSASELRWRESVDAIYIQAFQICVAMVMTQEKNLGSAADIESSHGYEMWSYQMPEILRGDDDDIAKAQQLLTKVGEYVEYLLETASQKAMRVPYLSLQYQQENVGLLLYIAQGIADEKRSNKVLATLEEMSTDILDQQDRSTLSLLETEYKRTVSLVLISARRAYDIQKKLNATMTLVKEVSAKFDTYREEMQRENVTFMKGIKRAKAFAYAEVAASITSSVVSFFSGGFDPGKLARAAKKVKDMALKLKRVMSLTKIFSKLAKLINILRTIQELSRTSSKAKRGRVERLFTGLMYFRTKRELFLMDVVRKGKANQKQVSLLVAKKDDNERLIAKYTKILKRVRNTRNSVEYLNSIIEGIVDAEKAKVTLKNVIKPQALSGVSGTDPAEETTAAVNIKEALENEFMIASGDNKEIARQLSDVLQDYSLDTSRNVVAEGEKLNAADVLEWDTANANVEGTMDASISMDIPETTSFKAALLKMNLAGKLKTQAMIDEAAIRVDLDRARFETTTYLKEGAEIKKKIHDIEQQMELRKNQMVKPYGPAIQKTYKQMLKDSNMRHGWNEFTVKLNILLATQSFCSAYYYFHLSPCPSEYSFDFGTSLREIVHMQRELQRQSLLRLEDFYPPPQTMQNRSLVFSKPNSTCRCIEDINNTNTVHSQLYGRWLSCASDEIQSTDTENKETRRLIQSLVRNCKINKVLEMQKFGRISVEVSINDSLAKDHSRVRIDDMKVILHGARTTSGVITVSIESSGLSEDRYGGEIFEFYGDKWRRDFAYYSLKSKLGVKTSAKDHNVQDWHVLDAADVYRSFRGVYRTATLFTTWVIKVDRDRNPGLDLTDLHTIELRFSGSFVAAGDEKYMRDGESSNKTSSDDDSQPVMSLRRSGVTLPDIKSYEEDDEEWYSSI